MKQRFERHCLYRHFDATGMLLYVGISSDVLVRTRAHTRRAEWFDQVDLITVEHFESRAELEDAEVSAIRREKPIFNKKHQPRLSIPPAPEPSASLEHIRLRLQSAVTPWPFEPERLYSTREVAGLLGLRTALLVDEICEGRLAGFRSPADRDKREIMFNQRQIRSWIGEVRHACR